MPVINYLFSIIFLSVLSVTNVYSQENNVLDDSDISGPEVPVIAPEATIIEQPPAVQAPINTPPAGAASANLGNEERARSVIIMVAAILLSITMGVLIVLLFLRGRKLARGDIDEVSEAYLVDIHGFTSNKQFQLGKKATMLGRVAGKEVGNMDYIVIPESTIGRRHAVIDYKDYAYWILDQGSINGTFVNNIPVTSEIRLKHGDIVRLHKYEFKFSIPEMEESTMTKVSNTIMAGHAADLGDEHEAEIDKLKDSQSGKGFELDLDFSFAESEPESSADVEAEIAVKEDKVKAIDETLLPGHKVNGNITIDGTDETLMPDLGSLTSETEIEDENEDENEDAAPVIPDDETLMPVPLRDQEDDATIIPNEDDLSDSMVDITGSDDEK